MCAERLKRANDRIRISAILLTLVFVGALMGACSKKDENNPSGSNNNPPSALEVSSMTPTNGATGVSQTAPVTVTFNRMVDAATVTSASLYIDGVGGTASASGATASFTPNSPLMENTQYMLVVTSAITDTAGVALSADTSITFTTGVRPSASAGNDREAAFNASVTLNGSSNIVGGIYQWNQLAGPSVGSLSGQAPAFTAPTVAATLIFELVVSDGSATSDPDTVRVFIVESGAGGVWVSETGSDASSGTRNDPVQTITKAVQLASSSAKDVYVAAGMYNESIELADNVSIYGGYNSNDWTRNYVMNVTTIMGGATAMRAVNAQNVVLEGLDIHSADATSPSESSVGVSLTDSRGAKIMHCSITAGNGAKGNDATRPGKPGTADGGNKGANAGGCSPANGGGSGGSGSGRAGGKGGTGGAAGGFDGGGGEGPCGGGGGGGFASAGGGGTDGCTGGDGADEKVPGPSFGEVVTGVYQVANGYYGSNGGSGGGGGGGGGGAGSLFGCGAGGGGGGAGGIGGAGGPGGAGGGGSFGIIASANSDVEISDVTITLGKGGDGGAGALGGVGGNGGSGGSGGSSATAGWSGGGGGDGGTGGPGGDGSGGGGGPCIAIVEQGSSTVQSNITFSLGQPGNGGGSSSSSVPGETGEQAEVKKLP